MRPIATDVARIVVCVSVCVGHTDVLCENGWTNRDTVWGVDSCGSKEPCVRLESRSDESIHSCQEWQVGNAAFCQITLDTCL